MITSTHSDPNFSFQSLYFIVLKLQKRSDVILDSEIYVLLNEQFFYGEHFSMIMSNMAWNFHLYATSFKEMKVYFKVLVVNRCQDAVKSGALLVIFYIAAISWNSFVPGKQTSFNSTVLFVYTVLVSE